MKKNILALSFILLAAFAFCSCGDDDEVVLSSDCYISNFSLGAVNRLVHTTSSTGEDSVYTVAYSAAGYYMSINQLDGTIRNEKPLPVNSQTGAILATIETSGTVIYRQASDASENWVAYSSTDSINFTNPLVFRVISADGASWRDYTVTVNVSLVDGEEFVWNKLAEPGLWTNANQLKTLVWGEKAWVFAQENSVVSVYSADADAGTQWEKQEVAGCEQADVRTLTAFDGRLYMSCTDGCLIASDDAINWNPVTTGQNGLHILTSDDTYLYAISGASLWRSADGMQWTEEELDEVADSLPAQDFASVAYVQTDGLRRVLLIGNRSMADYPNDTHAVVWGRGSRTETSDAGWMYYNWTTDNPYACPRLSPLVLLHYGDVLMACGGASIGGTSHEPLDNFYVSEDNGLTWKTSTVFVLPEDVRNSQGAFSATADAQNYLWLVAGGQVWRGRQNKYGL